MNADMSQSWDTMREMALQLKAMADGISTMYHDLVANPNNDDDSPTAIVSKRVFEASEKDGQHRELIEKFHKTASALVEFVTTADPTDKQNIVKLLLRFVDAREAQDNLRESAEKHLALIDKGVKELAAW